MAEREHRPPIRQHPRASRHKDHRSQAHRPLGRPQLLPYDSIRARHGGQDPRRRQLRHGRDGLSGPRARDCHSGTSLDRDWRGSAALKDRPMRQPVPLAEYVISPAGSTKDDEPLLHAISLV
eukprot:530085-Rhodomonas_salina.1